MKRYIGVINKSLVMVNADNLDEMKVFVKQMVPKAKFEEIKENSVIPCLINEDLAEGYLIGKLLETGKIEIFVLGKTNMPPPEIIVTKVPKDTFIYSDFIVFNHKSLTKAFNFVKVDPPNKRSIN